MIAPPPPRPQLESGPIQRVRSIAIAVLLPVVLFVLVRPDWYYLQNGLDPFFYTGYVQNFQNIFHAAGTRHYFISRWTIYLPQRLIFEIIGDPKLAFLIFRWIGAGLVTSTILWIGRSRWRLSDGVALAAVALMMPISIRALFSDYSDAVAFPLGTFLIALLILQPNRLRAAAIAGALFGAIIIANPFGATIAIAAVPFWLIRVPRKRWAPLISAAVIGAAAVLLGGMAFFRWRYGVGNIYSPTIDFIRTRSTVRDPLKSPRLWWLGYRLWIYLPGLLIITFHAMRRYGRFEFGMVERAVVSTCTLQYAIQIWFQFARHGSTLEISYYWSYIAPSMVLTFCVVVGALVQRCHRWLLPAIALALLGAASLTGGETPEVFQSWIDALVLLGVGAFGVRRAIARAPGFAPSALVGAVILLQTGSPRPEPILPDELRVLSSYELVYDDSDSVGVRSFEAATWFVEALSEVPEPVVRSAVFWYNSPMGARLSAVFGTQVSGRWLNPLLPSGVASDPFPQAVINSIQSGEIPTIIAIGSLADVGAIVDQFVRIEPNMRVVFEASVPTDPDVVVKILSLL